jgi:hypothetical protein
MVNSPPRKSIGNFFPAINKGVVGAGASQSISSLIEDNDGHTIVDKMHRAKSM